MKTVTLKVQTLETALDAFGDSWRSGQPAAPAIAFASWDLMHRVLVPRRLDLLRSLCGAGPISIRELARRVGRDFKGVHTDVTALLDAGIIDKDGKGVVFPYDRIHVEFDIEAAA